ncbi:hypothetical protein AGRA3207_007318 [Actinomadura graeca]|uniref:Uncharacterized protein n=1 Tax=Actinomadura graeca TaxID=2750812 RepID=A0ABX8R3Z4_9ACTN|nr:hypothetical protein AGRA3207_007318 [Actinomadura graeca]
MHCWTAGSAPCRRWTGGHHEVRLGQPPTPAMIARGLPVPTPDPDDPTADLLAAIGAAEPQDLLDRLSQVPPHPKSLCAAAARNWNSAGSTKPSGGAGLVPRACLKVE